MYNDIYRLVGERIEDPETFNSMLEVNDTALFPIVSEKIHQLRIMKIIGMRIEFYIDKHCHQKPYGDFYYEKDVFTRHVICGRYHGENYELTLSLKEGECCSGYTTMVLAELHTKKVDKFKNITYSPISPITIYYPFTMKNVSSYDTNLQIENQVFSIDSYGEKNGGCDYYPEGFYKVNMDLFRKNIRAKDKRPIWLFRGDSGAGKSFMAESLRNANSDLPFVTFETDMYKELPEKFPLKANVIVMGNKYKHSLDDVISRIRSEDELIIVNFDRNKI